MWEALDETPDSSISIGALNRVLDLINGKTALALGPGIGLHEETVTFVRELIARVSIPTVIDADGINAFAGHLDAIPPDTSIAITPHPGEAARLLECKSAQIQQDRLGAVRELAHRVKASVALKGFRTLVGEPSGRVRINLTGNPGMASGGTGDVLTGTVGSFLAQGLAVEDALSLGVYVHGLAGDLAAAAVGQPSTTATDLIREIPAALRQLATTS
jgi:NAD(P)H-hydrate epimerase